MSRRWIIRWVVLFLTTTGISLTEISQAVAFQLWEQDAANMGNDHAGRAAGADDASIAYYNPAGMVRIKNQQIVGGGAFMLSNIRFNGTVATNTLANPSPQTVNVQGGTYHFIPFVHYVAPLNDHMFFGLSLVQPFGFETSYGSSTVLRYAARKDVLNIYDLTPSLGLVFSDKLSLGFGFDIERALANFNQNITAIGQTQDTVIKNNANDKAYGCHLGILYQFSPDTRVGITYFSQVIHQLRGSSKLIGPLAGNPNALQDTENLSARFGLPPMTTVSLFHAMNPQWDMMGTVIYTQWNVTNPFTLTHVMGVQGSAVVSNLQTNLIQGYKNAWNYAIGTNYHPNEQWIFRGGVGFEESPVASRYRNVQIPDSNKISLGLGTHYQFTQTLGVDLGWTHYFAMNSRVNSLTQVFGDQTVITNGSLKGNTDTIGVQLKWDIL